ncbi:MAG: hypothetical protein V1859_10155 [archaeon]
MAATTLEGAVFQLEHAINTNTLVQEIVKISDDGTWSLDTCLLENRISYQEISFESHYYSLLVQRARFPKTRRKRPDICSLKSDFSLITRAKRALSLNADEYAYLAKLYGKLIVDNFIGDSFPRDLNIEENPYVLLRYHLESTLRFLEAMPNIPNRIGLLNQVLALSYSPTKLERVRINYFLLGPNTKLLNSLTDLFKNLEGFQRYISPIVYSFGSLSYSMLTEGNNPQILLLGKYIDNCLLDFLRVRTDESRLDFVLNYNKLVQKRYAQDRSSALLLLEKTAFNNIYNSGVSLNSVSWLLSRGRGIDSALKITLSGSEFYSRTKDIIYKRFREASGIIDTQPIKEVCNMDEFLVKRFVLQNLVSITTGGKNPRISMEKTKLFTSLGSKAYMFGLKSLLKKEDSKYYHYEGRYSVILEGKFEGEGDTVLRYLNLANNLLEKYTFESHAEPAGAVTMQFDKLEKIFVLLERYDGAQAQLYNRIYDSLYNSLEKISESSSTQGFKLDEKVDIYLDKVLLLLNNSNILSKPDELDSIFETLKDAILSGRNKNEARRTIEYFSEMLLTDSELREAGYPPSGIKKLLELAIAWSQVDYHSAVNVSWLSNVADETKKKSGLRNLLWSQYKQQSSVTPGQRRFTLNNCSYTFRRASTQLYSKATYGLPEFYRVLPNEALLRSNLLESYADMLLPENEKTALRFTLLGGGNTNCEREFIEGVVKNYIDKYGSSPRIIVNTIDSSPGMNGSSQGNSDFIKYKDRLIAIEYNIIENDFVREDIWKLTSSVQGNLASGEVADYVLFLNSSISNSPMDIKKKLLENIMRMRQQKNGKNFFAVIGAALNPEMECPGYLTTYNDPRGAHRDFITYPLYAAGLDTTCLNYQTTFNQANSACLDQSGQAQVSGGESAYEFNSVVSREFQFKYYDFEAGEERVMDFSPGDTFYLNRSGRMTASQFNNLLANQCNGNFSLLCLMPISPSGSVVEYNSVQSNPSEYIKLKPDESKGSVHGLAIIK